MVYSHDTGWAWTRRKLNTLGESRHNGLKTSVPQTMVAGGGVYGTSRWATNRHAEALSRSARCEVCLFIYT